MKYSTEAKAQANEKGVLLEKEKEGKETREDGTERL